MNMRCRGQHQDGLWYFGNIYESDDMVFIKTKTQTVPVIRESVGIDTGLKVANGESLFTGDIFIWNECKRLVVYRPDNLAFMAKPYKNTSIGKCAFYLKDINDPFKLEKIKIIGNIFEDQKNK